MTTHHAMLDSIYPPSESLYMAENVTGDISMMLCHGIELEEIERHLSCSIDDGEWEELYPDQPVPTDIRSLIDDVRAVYMTHIPENHENFQRLMTLGSALAKQGIAWSFDEGWDKAEAAEIAYEGAITAGHAGYAYCTNQDVDRAIHIGQLYIGFSSIKPNDETNTEVGRSAISALQDLGFTSKWNGRPTARILLEGIQLEQKARDWNDAPH